ncbi:unnamed protein product [[Actinomadura] parvosata subsp. kistnae]|uniref:Uncharacterized protein n=1 Tax=[Actinomadura] parvosata subsp. kistnae TaxID=1909395 RepID=A0A1U9ZWV0_9ACTN|nr:hypothetical protein [Nonomuraea sp. ATCC 55076]AQZ62389.1 hypothetical protein BKM31_13770 [Nonomuraea sp. ATCC 55076]SPL88598.1 unnamed protein product [Actinomadura parvosata subsp. kistnae]
MNAITHEVLDLLQTARDRVADLDDCDELLVRATQELIACAAEAVAAFPRGSVDGAREALSCARGAAATAAFAVRHLHDTAVRHRHDPARTGQHASGLRRAASARHGVAHSG